MYNKIKDILLNMKLRRRLMVFFILTATLSSLIGLFFSATYFNNFIFSSSKSNIEDKLQTALLLYDKKKSDIEKIARSISTDNVVILNLELLLYQPISTHFRNNIKSGNLSFLSILDENGKVIVSGNNNIYSADNIPVVKKTFLQRVLRDKKNTFITKDLSIDFFKLEKIKINNDLDRTSIVSVFPIYSTDKKIMGYIFAGNLLSSIDDSDGTLVNEIRKSVDASVLILDKNYPLAYSGGEFTPSGKVHLELVDESGSYLNDFYTIEVNRSEYLFRFSNITANSEKFSIYIGVGILKSKYLAVRNRSIQIFIFIAVISIFIGIVLSYFLSDGITRPILSMAEGTELIIKGNFKKKVKVNSRDELGKLANSFNVMTKRLKRRIEMDKLVSDMSRKFIKLSFNHTNEEIYTALDEISDYVAADKSSIFLVDHESHNRSIKIFHAWKNEKISHIKTRKTITEDSIPWLLKQIKSKDSIHILSVKKLPDEAGVEKKNWLDMNVKSIIVVPMFYGEKLRGFIIFEFIRKRDHATEEDILLIRMIAEIICNTLERHRSELALTNTKNYLKNLFNAQSSILISINAAGNIIQWNSAAEVFTNIPAKRAISKDIWETISFLNDFKESILHVSRSGEPLDLRRKSIVHEGNKYIDISLFPLSDNKNCDVLIRIDDKTEFTKKDAQLLQAQKMETVGTLAGGLAHDFNNVLSAITGTVSLMRHKVSTDNCKTEKFKEYVDIVFNSSLRAADMVGQLLTLSRKHEVSLSTVDLNVSIKHIVKMAANTFDKSIELSTEYYPESAMVYADPTHIEQALLNICVNAAHAMTIMKDENEKMGGELKIKVNKISSDKQFCISHPNANPHIDYFQVQVIDSGVGIKQEILSKIFDPFYTTKEKGKGTGLGLAMVYNIFKEHNGFIDITSKVGVGSTFTLYLPELKEVQSEEVKTHRLDIPRGSGTILVIDDEKLVRETAKNILVESGYNIITAENGKEGLEIFSDKRDEIRGILLDMVMPKMSGKITYKELKKMDPSVKVLLASGFKQDENVQDILKLGANDFIQKPFVLVDLASKIYNLVH